MDPRPLFGSPYTMDPIMFGFILGPVLGPPIMETEMVVCLEYNLHCP